MRQGNKAKSREIADLIITEMKAKSMTTKQLAEKSGCSERILEYWEKGKRNPANVDLISDILEILDTSYTLGKRDDFEK